MKLLNGAPIPVALACLTGLAGCARYSSVPKNDPAEIRGSKIIQAETSSSGKESGLPAAPWGLWVTTPEASLPASLLLREKASKKEDRFVLERTEEGRSGRCRIEERTKDVELVALDEENLYEIRAREVRVRALPLLSGSESETEASEACAKLASQREAALGASESERVLRMIPQLDGHWTLEELPTEGASVKGLVLRRSERELPPTR